MVYVKVVILLFKIVKNVLMDILALNVWIIVLLIMIINVNCARRFLLIVLIVHLLSYVLFVKITIFLRIVGIAKFVHHLYNIV